ncbi:MAG: DUF2933 domain-containing protein [Gammaproteobacteria bacterium]|nr:DUF2933 domain-containing protein [Gammaproteobacteria bacterium]
MEWLAQNWLWVLIGVVFVGMHLFGHGGHGGGGSGHGGHDSSDKLRTDDADPDNANPKKSSGHKH